MYKIILDMASGETYEYKAAFESRSRCLHELRDSLIRSTIVFDDEHIISSKSIQRIRFEEIPIVNEVKEDAPVLADVPEMPKDDGAIGKVSKRKGK
jgi:hypothetical protein